MISHRKVFSDAALRLRLLRVGWAWSLAILVVLPAAAGAQSDDGDYRIGARDVVTLKVLGSPDLEGSFTVSESGRINHPYLGEVELRGLTRAAAERKLKELLEEDLLQPGRASVTLEVDESRARSIHIIGAVENPGPLTSSRRWTLLEAITEAGGLTQESARRASIIRRSENGLQAQIEINLGDLLFRGDPNVNLPLLPDDVVNIPQAIEVTVYCLGEVNQPGAINFSSSDQMTLLAAISRAGGLTDRAKRKIVIKRRGAGNLIDEIVVDFKDVLQGRAPDIALEPGDVITIGMSFL